MQRAVLFVRVKGKFVWAGRPNQHARRMRSPEFRCHADFTSIVIAGSTYAITGRRGSIGCRIFLRSGVTRARSSGEYW